MNHKMEQEHWDVIVIGGGIAGLTASVYLARAGKKVLVLERAAQLGGRASTLLKNDCYFNIGPRALYEKGEGMSILRELGIKPHGARPALKGWLMDSHTRYTLPLGPLSLFKSQRFDWRAKKEFMSFYINLPKINTSELGHVTFKDWVETHVKHPHIKAYLYVLARLTTYCDEPNVISADAVLNQLQLRDVLYLDHGWQTLIDALHLQATEAKVNFASSAIAKEISGQFPNMYVELSNGSKLHTRSIISTANPRETLNMIQNHKLASKINQLDHVIPAKAACLDIALDRLIDPKTVYALALDQPLYYSVHSDTAVLSDNKQQHVIHVMKYLNSQHSLSTEETLQQLKSFMDLLQSHWEKHVIYQRFLPEMTVSHGIPAAKLGGLEQRPAPDITAMPGLFVAGDWVGKKGILADASFSSAKAAAHAIIEAS